MGLGWTGSYGATGGAQALAEILKQREIAQQRAFENQLKLRESARQDSELENQNLQVTAQARPLYAPDTFIGDSSPDLPRLKKYMQGTLRQVPSVPAMGPDFQGPSQNDLTPEEAQRGREGGYVTKPTGDQADKMADNARLDRTAGTQRPMTQSQEAATINKMAASWTAESKPTREMDGQVNVMHAGLEAARRGDLAQGSQVLMVTFQKILDPPSVVREAEYARGFDGQSFENQVRGYIERIRAGGGGLPLSELEKYAKLAEEMADVRYGDYLKGVRGRIEREADRYGIPHDVVFYDIPDASRTSFPAQPGAAPAPGPDAPPDPAAPAGPGPQGAVAQPEPAPVATAAPQMPPPMQAPGQQRAVSQAQRASIVPAPTPAPPPPPGVVSGVARPRGGSTPGRPGVYTAPNIAQPDRTRETGIWVTDPEGKRQGPFLSQAAADAFSKAAAAIAKQHAGTGKP